MSTTKYVFFLRGEKDAKYSETSKYVFGTYSKFFSSKLFHSVSIDMHIEKGNMDFLSVSTKMVFCIFGEARKMQTCQQLLGFLRLSLTTSPIIFFSNISNLKCTYIVYIFVLNFITCLFLNMFLSVSR